MLEDYTLKTRWLQMRDWRAEWFKDIVAEFKRVCAAPGWSPKVINLDDETDMVDLCAYADHDGGKMSPVPHSIQITKIKDHQRLSQLPKHTPRIVKQIYRKEFRLRALRVTDALPLMAELDKADAAWMKFGGQRS